MKTNSRAKLLIIVAVIALSGVACGYIEPLKQKISGTGSETNVPVQVAENAEQPVRTPRPTFTATPDWTATPTITLTPLPTSTPANTPTPAATNTPVATPTFTPNPAPQITITGATVNVRSGPGTNYSQAGQVSGGYSTAILGRNNDSSWVLINYPGGKGWVFSSLGQIQGNVNSAPVPQVAPPPPPPTKAPTVPPPPTNTPAPSYPFKFVEQYNNGTSGGQLVMYIAVTSANNVPIGGMKIIGDHSPSGAHVESGETCFEWCAPTAPGGDAKIGNVKFEPPAYEAGTWTLKLVDGGGALAAAPVTIPVDPANPQWYFLLFKQ